MKVSIVTAVFNARETILDALDSVRSQRNCDIEHIVIDGASVDGTVELLCERRDQIGMLVSERDGGIYDALNKGIQLASGDIVGFLHADDTFLDEHVISLVESRFLDPNVTAVYGDLEYVSRNDTSQVVRLWRAGEYSRAKLAWGWMPPHPTIFVRRGMYEQLGLFDTQFRISADYDWILRFLRDDRIAPVYVPQVLVRMRVGGVSNRSINNLIRKSAEDYRALRRNGVGGIEALVWKNISKLKQFTVRQRRERTHEL